MSLFKIKNKKNIIFDNRITLDAKHSNMIKKFNEDKKNLPTYNKKLNILKKKLNNYNKISLKKLTLEELDDKNKIEDDILDLNNKINNIKNNKNEHKYFLNTADILYNYYNQKSNNNTDNTKSNEKLIDKTDNENKTTILDFFGKKTISNKNKNNSSNKANLLNKYLIQTEKSNYITPSTIIKNCDICEKCKVEKYLYHSEGTLVCPKCGEIEYVVIDSDKPSYKDPPPEISYFAYKRINHFNEWLAQFQAKESTEIPQYVFDNILIEIKKERIENMASLSNKKIREYLKKLKLNKYYEHVPHIINRLNGLPPPIMSQEIEEKLRIMFKEIQGPFLEVCPKERKNFLSYSYVLHKFVELLELDEYKSSFPLLKSREKLHQQDLIWKDICKKLNWHYIKSI